MTPSACSLYDKIKLFKLKHGYDPEIKEVFSGGPYIQELMANGYVTIDRSNIEGFGSEIKTIRILK